MRKIKSILITIALAASINSVKAQINEAIAKSSIKIEMLFPEGKSKALILSFDDGPEADRRLVKLLNQYRLKGTFHLNSNKLGTKDYLIRDEIKDLFKEHEVSVHTANHPNLTTLNKADVVYEVIEDRKELERLTGITVKGMAYPFGNYNEFVIDAIKGLGIEYARTVNDTYNFSIPDDFLKWNPTIHQFGKAYFSPNNPVNDQKELAGFYKLVTDFVKSDTLSLFYVWGHSWENNGTGNRWNEMENFFKLVANNPAICYTTHIALVDYITAYRNLKFSVTKNIFTNQSSIDVFIKINNKVYKITAGTTFIIPE